LEQYLLHAADHGVHRLLHQVRNASATIGSASPSVEQQLAEIRALPVSPAPTALIPPRSTPPSVRVGLDRRWHQRAGWSAAPGTQDFAGRSSVAGPPPVGSPAALAQPLAQCARHLPPL